MSLFHKEAQEGTITGKILLVKVRHFVADFPELEVPDVLTFPREVGKFKKYHGIQSILGMVRPDVLTCQQPSAPLET